jgi:hypothetical protein
MTGNRNIQNRAATVILFAAANGYHGCETWSLTLREEHRLRVFGNRVLRGMFGPKGDEVTGQISIMGSFIICTHHQILLGRSNQGE